MAEDKVFKYYEQLPTWAKGAIAVATLGIIAFTGYKIYRKIQHDKALEDSKKDVKNANNDLKELEKKGIKPNFIETQYSSWASTLTKAFGECGTDEGIVMNVFEKVKNDADVLKLLTVYGTRKYGSCLLAGEWDDKEYSLPEALADESSSIPTINAMFTKKGIKYQF